MIKNLHPIQERAIKELDHSIVLRAGAGAGKTMVLTARIAEILNRKGAKSKILAITFTNKASEEMKARLLSQVKNDASLLENTRIQTIDSFCKDLIRNHVVYLGISPAFTVIEEGKSRQILERVIGEKIRKYYINDSSFRVLLEKWQVDFKGIQAQLLSLFISLRQNGHLKSFKVYDHSFNEEEKEAIVAKIRENLRYFQEKETQKANKLQRLLQEDRSQSFLTEGLEGDSLDKFFGELSQALKYLRSDKERKEEILLLIETLSREKEVLSKPYLDSIARLLKEVEEEFWQEKKQKAYMDFGDLLEQALRLCRNPLYKEKIQSLFDYILVDEFQDTNKDQIALIECIGQRANVFVVGDRKQSIYGFRGASISTSLEASHRMAEEGAKVLSMEQNYRSRPMLMDYINGFFQEKMEAYQCLEGNGKIQVGEFGLVDLREEGLDAEEQILKEANFVAQKVKEFLAEEGEYSMGLLLRSKSKMEIYEGVFRQENIPFINRSSQGFFQTREIKDMLILLHYLQKPHDPLYYMALLRSPFVGLGDETIYRVFQKGLAKFSDQEEEKLKFCQDLLSDARAYCHRKTVEALVYKILYHWRFLDAMVRSPRGEQAAQNLLYFLELAQDYDHKEGRGLGGFLDYLDNKKSYEDIPQAHVESLRSHLEISTIHKSKGLEYDIVFLGDLNHSTRASSAWINFSPKYGAALRLDEGHYIYDKIRQEEKTFEEEERIRLLYVAMTRARSGLYILCSSEKNKGFTPYLDYDNFIKVVSSSRARQVEEQELPLERPAPSIERIIKKPLLSPSYLLQGQKENIKETKFQGQKKADLIGNYLHSYASFAKKPLPSLKKAILDQAKNSLSQDSLCRLQTLIETYDKSLTETVLATELPFQVEFENFQLQGVFDQIREIDGKIHLIDLKTGILGRQTPLLDQYIKQIQLYGLSWQKIYGDFPVLELFFLSEEQRMIVDPIEEEKLMGQLNQMLFTIS